MNNTLLLIKVKERLNKLDSKDYDNVKPWQIEEAFNKEQREWTRRQLHGSNLFKEGDEQSKRRIDDLQILLKSANLVGAQQALYFESKSLPEDYLEFKRVSAYAQSDCCPKRMLTVYEGQEADRDILLRDKHTAPNFEWAETFCTLINNKVRIYRAPDFEIIDPVLTYYRFARDIQIIHSENPSTGQVHLKEVTCEFKDDIVELLIDGAAAILAGDLENMNQYQRSTQNAERNN